jgi:hypothetical protein
MKPNAEQKIREQPNKALHWTGIPLHFKAAGELERWRVEHGSTVRRGCAWFPETILQPV